MQLVKYNAACKAVAAAKSVDEVKGIRDKAVAMAAYARQAKNKDLEADAVEIRMRATRRLDQLRQAQGETVGFNKGAAGGGKKDSPRGLLKNPRDNRPTLKSQGIDKNLANQGRTLGKLTDAQFEKTIAHARDAVTRASKIAIRAAAIEQSREGYQSRASSGGTVKDLALIGEKFSVIYADPPWQFKVYSGKGKQRSADRHYDTMDLNDIKKLPVQRLAAKDCALFLWCVCPEIPGALAVIESWGFDYKTVGFVWVKQNRSGKGLFTGMGYWSRANAELCLFATRGNPQRVAKNVHQIISSPVSKHSEKPDETRRRIERLVDGPYLELFGRKPVKGWTVWGNEI